MSSWGGGSRDWGGGSSAKSKCVKLWENVTYRRTQIFLNIYKNLILYIVLCKKGVCKEVHKTRGEGGKA